MRERAGAILIPCCTFGLIALAIGAIRPGEAYLVTSCAILACLAHFHTWLWFRCRSWPVVQGSLRGNPAPREPVGSSQLQLQIEYTVAGATFSRPAHTKGAVGEQVSLRVDPSRPEVSSLDVPAPRIWLAVYVVAASLLVASLFRAIASAWRAASE